MRKIKILVILVFMLGNINNKVAAQGLLTRLIEIKYNSAVYLISIRRVRSPCAAAVLLKLPNMKIKITKMVIFRINVYLIFYKKKKSFCNFPSLSGF